MIRKLKTKFYDNICKETKIRISDLERLVNYTQMFYITKTSSAIPPLEIIAGHPNLYEQARVLNDYFFLFQVNPFLTTVMLCLLT